MCVRVCTRVCCMGWTPNQTGEQVLIQWASYPTGPSMRHALSSSGVGMDTLRHRVPLVARMVAEGGVHTILSLVRLCRYTRARAKGRCGCTSILVRGMGRYTLVHGTYVHTSTLGALPVATVYLTFPMRLCHVSGRGLCTHMPRTPLTVCWVAG